MGLPGLYFPGVESAHVSGRGPAAPERLRVPGKLGRTRGGSDRLDVVESIEQTDASVATVSSVRRMEYNDAGRLWRLYEDGVLLAEYVYNAAGQRTRKVVHEGESSTVTVFHYGLAGELLSETDGAGRSLRDYVWVNGQTVAQIDVVRGDNGSSRDMLLYLYPDHLMTSRAATDDTGQVVWTWDGGAFGDGAADTDPDGDGTATHVSLRFPGQYQDAESGWHYNWNRYYDPSLGRYLQSDPIGYYDGLNTYAYVHANPIKYTDTLGLLVDAYYNSQKGEVTVRDRDTGQTVTVPATSGGVPFGERLPDGKYEILDRAGNPESFRLDPVDENPRNDRHDPSGRHEFRLHEPGNTTGCIAVDNRDDWERVRDLINNTRTDTVMDRAKPPWWAPLRRPRPITRYGDLYVY